MIRRLHSRVLALVVGAVSVLAGVAGSDVAMAEDGERAGLDPGSFRAPGPSLRPGFSWWWPGPAVDDAELRAEVAEMAAAGFGNAQIFEVPGFSVPTEGLPPETFLWGTPHWVERIRTAMEAAVENDFVIDPQVSSGWPWTSPAVAGDNVDLSVQQLGFGERALTGPSNFSGPPPEQFEEGDRQLVAVTAARRDPAGTDPVGRPLLDPESAVDLTPTLDAEGNLDWDVPPGEWVLFGFWQAPTRSTGAAGVGYVIDFLNRESTEAATEYLDEHLYRHLGRLPREAGGVVHQDSLEAIEARLHWTDAFLEEFRDRRGYELTRYLPALSVPEGEYGPSASKYDFPGSVGERVRRDYAQTLTELWVENHVGPASKWARRHGLEYAARTTGDHHIGFNVVEVAKSYPVPEVDHITSHTIDRVLETTSAAHLSGAARVQSELGDLYERDYMITLETLKRLGDRQFVGGVTALDLHGYPYKSAHGSDWPSWWIFSTEYPPFSCCGVSEGFNPEIPLWQHLPRLADYFARAQAVLRAGRPVADIALYRDSYGFELNSWEDSASGDAFEPAVNSALTRSGFNFDIVNPDTLSERSTAVQRGRLVVRRPGYKALVIDLDASRRGVVDNTNAMGAATARRLLSFADRRLPIVFVGQFPERGVSYGDPDREDAAVRAAVAELARSPRVRLVEDAADVPAALAELGVEADLSFDGTDESEERCGFGAECVYSVHRRTGKGDYWFLWNDGAAPVRFTASFAPGRRAAPELWDLWSGDRRPVGQYRVDGERIEVPMELAPRETTVIGFERPVSRHVVSTTATEVIARGHKLFLRSSKGGEVRATLSDGRKVAVDLPELPASIEPELWQLHVDGAVREGEEVHDLELTELQDWRVIPELQHTSGTGTYTTTVNLTEDWAEDGRGAYLELGRVEGGVQLRVNGQLVYPAAVPPPRLDIGPFLQPGENTIEVELTTTLKNRLVEMSTHVPGYQRFLERSETQPYGLLGPVRLTPYAEHAIPKGSKR